MPGMAQQDEGPVLKPTKPTSKPVGVTLAIMCDLACEWKLNGDVKGTSTLVA